MLVENDNNVNSTQDLPKSMKPKLSPVTFQELIRFKEELLKELREYKSNTTKNVYNEFNKYSELIEKVNTKMSYLQQEKSAFYLKSEFIQEKCNILENISIIQSELKNQIRLNEVQMQMIKKDLEDSLYRYDKAIVDNLQVPGLVGNSCRFPNLKEYILSNKEELSNIMILNKQTSMEFNSFKKRTDTAISQINDRIKSQEYKLLNILNTKYNELKEKYDGLYLALDGKIHDLSSKINIEIVEKNKETDEIKKLIYDNKKSLIENDEILKEEFIIEVESLKKSIQKVGKNIINLSKLLSGKNNGLNKQLVINNFNNMMKNLYKEINMIK